MKMHDIPVTDILLDGPDFDDFIFTYPLKSGALTESIQIVGLLHPVCLKKLESGWQIIFGARRILACRELGWEKIPAQIYDERELTNERALQISLEEDLLQKELNPVEQARVLFKFLQLENWDLPRVLQEIVPRLGIPPSVEIVKNYLAMLNLEEEYQIAVANGSLTPAHAFQLQPLSSDERRTIFEEVFQKCRPNVNEGRELIEYLTDLKIILKKRVQEILSIKTISEFLNAAQKSPREKCSLLRKALKKLRYPELSKLEERYSGALKELGLKGNIRVRPAPFLRKIISIFHFG
jgi:ParB/RepB/Spo0J family partition protein